MALQAAKELTSNAALRLGPPSIPSSPTRRTSNSSSSAPPKSRILALLDAELANVNQLRPPALPAPKSPNKAEKQSLFVKGLSGDGAGSSAKIFGDTWPPASATSKKPKSGPRQKTTKSKPSSSALPPEDVLDAFAAASLEKLIEAQPVKQYSHRDYAPTPTLVYVSHEDEANDLVRSLKGPLGFDLEWRVIIRRGHPVIERRTATVQLSDENLILVIQVSAMQKFPQKLKELIESPDVVKIGANIANDGRKLFGDFGILAQNLVELGGLAREADPKCTFTRSITALATVVEKYTGKHLDKGRVRSSNWEEMPLNKEQLEYAANDAHCALVVYKHLQGLADTSGRIPRLEKFTANLKNDYDSGKLKIKTFSPPISRESTASESSLATEATGTSQTSSSGGHRGWDQPVKSGDRPRPQHLRAYGLWYHQKMSMDQIRAALRSKENPLAVSTVISYVVYALQADTSLPFSMVRLKEFVQLEAGSWKRHRDWMLSDDAQRRGQESLSDTL